MCAFILGIEDFKWLAILFLLIIGLIFITNVWVAAPFLILLGALGGFLVVPMNALLQHRGYTLLTAGRSVAVQGFNENAGMLVMLAVYATAIAWDLPLKALILSFGVLVAAGMALVYGMFRLTSGAQQRV